MQVFFISATHRFGTSFKKSPQGVQYDICNLAYGDPVEPVSQPNMTFYGHGAQVREIGLAKTAMSSFETVKVGQLIELIFTPNPENPRMNIVSGWKPVKQEG
ncbi:hypothetical protein [Vibrio mangrovi]|uniref:Uncharacterized protein n=1 Tax=Vibrio mangrovi TaxID=474394 RepID=A0A1Y6ISY3_9VIBR|nr:hypothetical protein [Vibrio mangrovi]MDW6004444.1 hypothetical protein [Vibrio mangrovi]MDW6004458.1 hypothetical protein [Vibrio mangrovi]SMS00746.1 hypothetical protein VIM7927_02015 [Vibrio mangrovi]